MKKEKDNWRKEQCATGSLWWFLYYIQSLISSFLLLVPFMSQVEFLGVCRDVFSSEVTFQAPLCCTLSLPNKIQKKGKNSVMPGCPWTEEKYLSMLIFTQLCSTVVAHMICSVALSYGAWYTTLAGHLGGNMSSSPLRFYHMSARRCWKIFSHLSVGKYTTCPQKINRDLHNSYSKLFLCLPMLPVSL